MEVMFSREDKKRNIPTFNLNKVIIGLLPGEEDDRSINKCVVCLYICE